MLKMNFRAIFNKFTGNLTIYEFFWAVIQKFILLSIFYGVSMQEVFFYSIIKLGPNHLAVIYS